MLPTGLADLDRKLRGGVPPGSLVAFTAPPETQSELLLEQVARNNDSSYVTTVRDEETGADRLPETTVRRATAEDLLSDPGTHLDVPDGGCLVVDAVTRLERRSDAYRDFLEAAARRPATSTASCCCTPTTWRSSRRNGGSRSRRLT